ncbi:ribosome small subunit-dependent GTPase A [Urechidicola croceus]|uniref:Small ribosomal subunit biogenesis GTPase RsgA n=1 Tax=Urechidicola croceus TaxID=1850246 RepID=A0A1D8P7K2_9FLAO|nr:ribosome small subunit-dependent GTPase A [Urechidicola croceus]AOW20554.1 ribosome small subunit-dependent GTPase A [Urechidicola croceus]
MTGLVSKSTGSWYTIRIESGNYYECRIRGKFRMEDIKSTNPIAVGDIVDFDLEENKDTGVITNIHERKNYIVRKSVNLSKQTHIIAANIDVAFLLVTVDNPPTFPGFIDRFLATAEAYNISAVLLFNKVDSYDNEQFEKKEELSQIYSDIGYLCIDVSATENFNIDLVKELMIDRVSMFSGHSGVGKSTLINTIEPTLNIKTAEISQQHGQGQHTTTFAEMHELSFGGFIIDTPGIKGFGVVDFEPHQITDYFPEFFKLKKDCKFSNCLHQKEPQCAVKKALENDEIAPSRYFSYLQMIKGDEEHYRQSQFMH